jgi:Leucine-rich repeat (LRR) protein
MIFGHYIVVNYIVIMTTWYYKEFMEYVNDPTIDSSDVIELNLSNNDLTTIPDSIKNLTNLEILYLTSNKITKIENLPPNIIELYLENNEITKIENLPVDLERLNLASNKITKIENLKLKYLSELILTDNKIKNIPLEIARIPNLNYFRYDGNPIKNIHEKVYLFLESKGCAPHQLTKNPKNKQIHKLYDIHTDESSDD